jgi:hypothetical protein
VEHYNGCPHTLVKAVTSSVFVCVYFFNPYTNKQAGKKASIGIISLVCLSLPPDLHYKPENMWLGLFLALRNLHSQQPNII